MIALLFQNSQAGQDTSLQAESGEKFEESYSLVLEKLEVWMETAVSMLPNFVVAILVLIMFYLLGRMTRQLVRKLLHRTTTNKTIINLLDTVTGIIIIGTGVFIALSVMQLDGTVNKLLAGAGIIGLALGFAFQDIASNFISGVILSVRHPFGIGDIIETNDFYGIVVKLDLRNTLLRTPQGQIIFIPNKEVFGNPLINYTKEPNRRIDLECGISYAEDLEKVQKLAEETIRNLDCCDRSRAIELYYHEFGDSSINFTIRFWIKFNSNKDYWSARSRAIVAIKKVFDENDIMIPFPIRTLDFGIRGGEKLNTMLVNPDGNGKKSV